MKQRFQGFFIGVLLMVFLFGISATAFAMSETINITFRGIRIVVNNELITPMDGGGNVVEPFIWNGTTYLPVRAVADALGQEVRWDDSTSTVYLWSGQPQTAPLPNPSPTVNGYTFGSAINFNGLEITFHNAVEWLVIDNRFSNHHGADVFRMPVSITNVTDNPNGLLMHQYEQFGIDGTQLSSMMSINFEVDDSLSTMANQILPGITLNTHMNFLYVGDGIYTVAFNPPSFREPTIQIQLPIYK